MDKENLVDVTDLNLPEQYDHAAQEMLRDSQEIYGDKLRLFMITGSCALGQCIEGFSDIDLMLVSEGLNFNELHRIQESAKKHMVRIALTAYTQSEIEAGSFDDKTHNFMYQLNQGLIAPSYKDSDLKLPTISLEKLQEVDRLFLPSKLHRLKRTLHTTAGDKVAMIKMLYTAEKMKLRSAGHNIIATSYQDAVDLYADEFHARRIDITPELNYERPASDDLIDYAREIVEDMANNPET